MKTPLLSALAVLALASAPAYAQDVTFKKAGLTAGDTRTETTKSNSDVDVTITNNGQQVQAMKQKGEEHLEKVTEILAAADGKPTKIQVEYKKMSQIRDTPMTGRQEDTDALEGKSFILEKSGDAISVTDAKGAAVDDLTADKVKTKEADLFKDDPLKFSKILPDRAIKVGETIEVDKEKAAAIFSQDGNEELKIEKMTLTLKETKDRDGAKVAVFDVSMKGSLEPQGAGGPKIELGLSGTLELGVDNSWPYEMKLSGPLGFKQVQGPMEVNAAGTSTITITAKYGRKGEATGG